MDFLQITGLMSGLKATTDLCAVAISARDSAKTAAAVAQLRDQLLQSQEVLFTLREEAFAMQQKLMESQDQVRKLQAAADESARYQLVELGVSGNFAYALRRENGQEPSAEPAHYVCQPCFSGGRKVVLGRHMRKDSQGSWRAALQCPVCQHGIFD